MISCNYLPNREPFQKGIETGEQHFQAQNLLLFTMRKLAKSSPIVTSEIQHFDIEVKPTVSMNFACCLRFNFDPVFDPIFVTQQV